MNNEYKGLEEELINFYDQSKELFVEGSVLRSTIELPKASMDKTKGGATRTVFEFVPILNTTPRTDDFPSPPGHYASHIVMGMFIEIEPGKRHCFGPKYTTITVNTASYLFEQFLKSFRGFELSLLHQMIHLKCERDKIRSIIHLHTPSFNHADACGLLASFYESFIDCDIEHFVHFKSPRQHAYMKDHNIHFVSYCYYMVENLMENEELLTRVLNGRALEGNTTWEKKKWLIKQFFLANHLDPLDYMIDSDKNIMPDIHFRMDEIICNYLE